MDKSEEKFTKGFNHGYLLAKYLPGLLSKLIKNLTPSNTYFQGFFSGKEEYELEQSKDQLKDLRGIRSRSKDRGRNVERDL